DLPRVAPDPDGRHEEPARPEPRADPAEQRPELLTGQVRQRVERNDGVEGRGRPLESRHGGDEEFGVRDVGPGSLDLARTDVDTGDLSARRDPCGHRDAGAAAELEDVRTGRDPFVRPAEGL